MTTAEKVALWISAVLLGLVLGLAAHALWDHTHHHSASAGTAYAVPASHNFRITSLNKLFTDVIRNRIGSLESFLNPYPKGCSMETTTTGGGQSLLAFAANWLMGFGEIAVPFRWLNRVSPYGDYPLVIRLGLMVIGVPVMILFFIWVLGRQIRWLATGRRED